MKPIFRTRCSYDRTIPMQGYTLPLLNGDSDKLSAVFATPRLPSSNGEVKHKAIFYKKII